MTAPATAFPYTVETAIFASALLRFVDETSDKYYQVFLSENAAGDLIPWVRFGKWDDKSNCPATEICKLMTQPKTWSDTNRGRMSAASDQLFKKYDKGYRPIDPKVIKMGNHPYYWLSMENFPKTKAQKKWVKQFTKDMYW